MGAFAKLSPTQWNLSLPPSQPEPQPGIRYLTQSVCAGLQLRPGINDLDTTASCSGTDPSSFFRLIFFFLPEHGPPLPAMMSGTKTANPGRPSLSVSAFLVR
jgi:hypothetical protein